MTPPASAPATLCEGARVTGMEFTVPISHALIKAQMAIVR